MSINVRFMVQDAAQFEQNPELEAAAQRVAEQVEEAIKDLGLKGAHPEIVGHAVVSWLQGGEIVDGAARALGKLALTGQGKAAKFEILAALEGLEAEDRPGKRGPGRPKKDGGRSEVLQAKCSPEVKEAWHNEAKRRGIPLSDLVAEIARGFPTA